MTDHFSDYGADGISEDARRLLDAIPKIIGEEPGDQGAPAAIREDDSAELDEFAELGEDICDPDDMAECIEFLCEWLADKRNFDEYLIGPRKTARLSKPYARMVNSIWSQFAPALLRELSARVPGFASSIVLSIFIFGPIVRRDMKRAKERRGKVTEMPTPAPAAPPSTRRAPGGGFVRELSPDEQ